MNRDDELFSRLSGAVTREATTTAGDPAGLAERLIDGTRRRQRTRTNLTAIAAAVAALAVGGVGGYGLLSDRSDRLDTADSPSEPEVPVQTAGAVTPEQASRAGVDGTIACAPERLTAAPMAPEIDPGLTLYAAYVTDTAGYETWSREYLGSSGPDVTTAGGLFALCWFTGDVPKDGSVPGTEQPFTHQVLAVQLAGPTDTNGLRLDGRSPRPLPVLAPPVPDQSVLPPDIDGSALVTHPQPPGVPVVDELVAPPAPEPAPAPADCVPIGCPLDGEVEVRVEIQVDGQPLDARDTATLPAGTTVPLNVLVQVEDGEQITGLYVGVAGESFGIDPGGPTGIELTLIQEATLTGERRYELDWTVPSDRSRRSLVIGYRQDAGESGEPLDHARTVGGIQPG